MAFDSTITEHDLDPSAQSLVQNLNRENFDIEPDLAVDGLSESLLSRILGLFSRAGH